MNNTAHISPELPESDRRNANENAAGDAAAGSSAEITPEIMTVIEAAVTAFAGKKARIVSVKQVPEAPSPRSSWASHGLTLVHGSHNLVQRGR